MNRAIDHLARSAVRRHFTSLKGGRIRFVDEDGAKVSSREVAVDPDRSPWTTVATIASLLVLLGVTAYGISLSGPLRAGRRRRSALVALPLLGLVPGPTLVVLAWSLGIAPEPTTTTFLLAAVLSAAVGALAAPTALRLGRRRRLRAAIAHAPAN